MRNKANPVAIGALVVVFAVAAIFDVSLDYLKHQAGSTFEFSPVIWARLAMNIAFALLISWLLWLSLAGHLAAAWVYWVYLLIPFLGLAYWPSIVSGFYVLQYVLPRWLSQYLGAGQYLDWAGAFIFCAGIFGLFRHRRAGSG